MTSKMMFSPLSLQRVDRENGRIIGAAVATIGEAKGHGVWIDESTLTQVADLGKLSTNGVKMRWGHPLPFDSAPGAYAGKAYNFRVEGDKCLCDIQLAKVKNLKGDIYEYTLDLAETAPDSFGLSMAFDYTNRKGKKGKYNGLQLVDITALDAIDFVDTPAANYGLFKTTIETKETKTMSEKKTFKQWEARFGLKFAAAYFDDLEFDDAGAKWAEVTMADLLKENQELKTKCSALESKLADPPIPPKQDAPPQDNPPKDGSSNDDVSVLKARIAELEAKLKEAGVKMSAYSKGQSEAPKMEGEGKELHYMDKVNEFAKSMSKGGAYSKATKEFPELYSKWVSNNRK